MLTLAVGWVAEFIYRCGDLHTRALGQTLAEEGIRTQQRLQAGRDVPYQREVVISGQFSNGAAPFKISGRIDGLQRTEKDCLIEEFKTTRAPAEQAHAQLGDIHWAQARLYAALLVQDKPEISQVQLRLIYCHPDSLDTHSFDITDTCCELSHFLDTTVERLSKWLTQQAMHQNRRDDYLTHLNFPFDQFRPHQRPLAGKVYRHLEASESLLLEAATGSGKTSGILFPALRVLGSKKRRQIFYLTSRGTGAGAIWNSVKLHDPHADQLRVIRIVAKEQVCPVAGMPCGPEQCPYSREYYAKLPAARAQLLGAFHMKESQVAAVAEQHEVCPFELSLDTAQWSDLIIADYNYLLDPVVRLRRFSDGEDALLLVDEAHQLEPRMRSSLSASLSRSTIRKALSAPLPGDTDGAIRSLDRLLLELCRHQKDQTHSIFLANEPRLEKRLQRVLECFAQSPQQLDTCPDLQQLIFDVVRWCRVDAAQESEDVGLILHPGSSKQAIVIELVCLNAAPYLASIWERYPANVRFSGTLTPLDLFQQIQGVSQGNQVRIQSAYRPEQLGVWIVPDISTYYRQRRATISQAVELVRQVSSLEPGHYLAAFPSFEYLESFVAEISRSVEGESGCQFEILAQHRRMNAEERQAFLQRFSRANKIVIGAVILGGIFGESIDFQQVDIKGVFCFGPGLPPPDILNEERRAHLARKDQNAHSQVYIQPAMTKIVQMAGRILRSPAHRGVVCLVDPRFQHREYQRFFPSYWQPRAISAAKIAVEVANFWNPR